MTVSVGLVGGRGYTGAELLGLVARHPSMDLAFASSSSNAGRPVRTVCPSWPDSDARLVNLTPDSCSTQRADAWVLAVPNGVSQEWAAAIRSAQPGAVILDLSADHRFDPSWVYGLPERYRDRIAGARDIANPGCYATGAQLALLPLLGHLSGPPAIFGVSGYSGAGRTPSDRNNPERLRDNLIPYSLTNHVHEREITAQLGVDVRFMPHVASFFRGISLTISATIDSEITEAGLLARYRDAYAHEPRVKISAQIPEVAAVRETPDIHIGGFAVDRRDPGRVTLVAVLDNLSKGAASQAMQNLNLALGCDEHCGLHNTGNHHD